ncbi:MAG: hypothetical protein AAF598_16245 [Bacteroidota bacterium]
MSETPLTYFDRFDRPVIQALLVLAGSFAIMGIGKLLGITGIVTVAEDFPWLCSASFLLFFAMFNAIIALSTQDLESYFRKSILAFVGLLVLSLGLAFGFSGKWVSEAGSYKTIFIILTFGYLALLSIGGLIKRIAMILQKEEEQYRQTRK